MSNLFQPKSLSLDNLILWDENARFPDNYSESSEQELIDYFLSKKEFKMEILLDEIINDFDLPQIEKFVVWQDSENHIVLEGNRRLACYKILSMPQIIEKSYPKLYSKLIARKKDIIINGSFVLECLISKDKSDCYRFVDRKHNKGNNEVSWNEPERNNYSLRRGKENFALKLKLALSNYIRNLDLPSEIIATVLGQGYVTNLYRLTTTGPAREIFNLGLNESGGLTFDEKSAFPEKLKVIVFNLFEKKDFKGETIDSRRLNKNEEIKGYLINIKPKDVKTVDSRVSALKKTDLFGKETLAKPLSNFKSVNSLKKVIPKSTDRKHLIPDNCRITITSEKINNIYHELRDGLLIDDSTNAVPNAVGVLFRVFLEISLDYYAEQNGTLFKKEDTIKKKIPWVVKHLTDKGYDANTFSEINKVGSAVNEKTFLSIERFHEYIHSKTVQPCPAELKAKWILLQSFFELLWDDLNRKKE